MATESFFKRFVINEDNIDFFVKLMNENNPTVICVKRRISDATEEDYKRYKKIFKKKGF